MARMYITGTIHSTEAGAPTALMELAYRLAVDAAATSAISASASVLNFDNLDAGRTLDPR